MGKIILCTGKLAEIPYTFAGSHIGVYSIEELSYYLYTHIYEVYEDFLQDDLIDWVRNQVGMEELAAKLERLKSNKNNLKDIIVTILCSNDYYTEKEMKELIVVIDQIMELPPIKRKKIRGDYFLKYEMYQNALEEYQRILKDNQVKVLNEVEYACILHNMGIVYAHTTSYQEATSYFQEAFKLGQNPESLKQYMLAILLSGDEKQFEEQRVKYHLPESYKKKLYHEMNKEIEKAENLPAAKLLQRIKRLRESGKKEEYRTEVTHILAEWKKEYRRQCNISS